MIYFTADPHFGHPNIIKFCDRPFIAESGKPDVYKMNQTIINNWNNVVDDDDEVYLLGDFAFKTSTETIKYCLQELKGKIYFIIGNHDRMTLKVNNQVNRFEWVKDFHEVQIEDNEIPGGVQRISLMHYPMISWPGSGYGSWQLYGHVHGSHVTDNPAQLDVGVDSHSLCPVSYEEVKLMITKQFIK